MNRPGIPEDTYLGSEDGVTEKKATSKRYPPELKERAVRMVKDLRQQDPGDKAVISRVARQLGVGDESLRAWVKQSEIDTGARAGLSTAEHPELREVAQSHEGVTPLQRHLAGGRDFLRGGARPPTKEVVAFIDAHRDNETGGRRWGVEPICAELAVAPSTYYDTKSRPPSARALRDAQLGPALVDLWKHNYSVYGRRKLTKAARRAGHDVGRDQVARLMRNQGIRGASRSKKRFTTKSDPTALRAPDLVNRNFSASRPTSCGSPISRTARRGRASSTSPS